MANSGLSKWFNGKRLIALLVIAVVAGVGLSVAVWVMLVGPLLELGDESPETSAVYYPADTLSYFWFNPKAGSMEQAISFRKHFDRIKGRSSFDGSRAELRNKLYDEFGLELDDVLVWAGSDISGAILSVDPNDLSDLVEVAVIEVSDMEKAMLAAMSALAYRERMLDERFTVVDTGEFSGWVGDEWSIALGKDVLVVSNKQRGLYTMMQMLGTDDHISLADSPLFQEAVATLEKGRIGGGYIALKDVTELLRGKPVAEDGFISATPEWAALSLSSRDYGLRLDVIGPAVAQSEELAVVRLDEAARVFPAGTIAMVHLGVNPDINRWRAELAGITLENVKPVSDLDAAGMWGEDAENFADVFDAALEAGSAIIGIDIEREFLAHLDGNVVMGITYVPPSVVWSDGLGGLVLLGTSANGEEAMTETVHSLVESAEAFFEVETLSLSDGYGWRFGGDELGAGVGVAGQWVIIGSDVTRLDPAAWSGEESLAADELFIRARDAVGDGRHLFGYMDTDGLFGREEYEGANETHRLLVADSLEAIAISDSGSDEDFERVGLIFMLDGAADGDARSE